MVLSPIKRCRDSSQFSCSTRIVHKLLVFPEVVEPYVIVAVTACAAFVAMLWFGGTVFAIVQGTTEILLNRIAGSNTGGSTGAGDLLGCSFLRRLRGYSASCSMDH